MWLGVRIVSGQVYQQLANSLLTCTKRDCWCFCLGWLLGGWARAVGRLLAACW